METVEFFCNKIQPNIVVNEVSLNIDSIVNDSTSDNIARAVYMILHAVVWFDDRMGLQILLLDIEINALQKLSFAQYACYMVTYKMLLFISITSLSISSTSKISESSIQKLVIKLVIYHLKIEPMNLI